MAKQEFRFEDFLKDVNLLYVEFVTQLNDYLLESGCALKIELAKNGYVVSYNDEKSGKVVANFVFRKNGLIIRIYGDHIGQYSGFLETLPEGMVKAIEKAPICKRLMDPMKCNSRCRMGYMFSLKGAEYKKCRFNSFMFLISDENNPFIKAFLENEMSARALDI